jgi:hypothetical protein
MTWKRALCMVSAQVHTVGSAQVIAFHRNAAEANWLAAELHARAAVDRKL